MLIFRIKRKRLFLWSCISSPNHFKLSLFHNFADCLGLSQESNEGQHHSSHHAGGRSRRLRGRRSWGISRGRAGARGARWGSFHALGVSVGRIFDTLDDLCVASSGWVLLEVNIINGKTDRVNVAVPLPAGSGVVDESKHTISEGGVAEV